MSIDQRIPVLAAVVLGSLALVASGGSSGGGSSGSNNSNSTLQGLGSANASKDAKVTRCLTDSAGYMEAVVKITNHSSGTSDYSITVEFDGKRNGNQLDTGDIFVSNLRAGQSTIKTAQTLTNAPKAGFVCKFSEVQRTASS